MNRAAFFEAAGTLAGWVESLSSQTESFLFHIEDELCQKRQPIAGELPTRSIVAMEIGAIRDRIGEVMCAFDNLCQAAGIARPYELALRLLEASRPVKWKVKQVLDGKEAALLPRTCNPSAPNFPPSTTGGLP